MGKSRLKRRVKAMTAAQQHELRQLFTAGVELHQRGNLIQAEELYQLALKLDPGHADSLHLLGVVANQKGDNAAACEWIGQAIIVNPDVPQYHFNRGVSLQALDRHQAAVKAYRRAVRLKQDYREAYENLGVALQDLDDLEGAKEAYRKAIDINNASPIGHQNLGTLLNNLGHCREAEQHFDQALAHNPVYAEARWKRALVLLRQGRFEEGWTEYEWRFYAISFLKNNPPVVAPFPKWDGSPLTNKSLLITPEQGIGDEIMFASCFGDVIEQAQACYIECDKRLVPLFERSFPQAHVTAAGAVKRAAVDYRISAGSVCQHLHGERAEGGGAYLRPSREATEKWRERLSTPHKRLNVGVSWTGGKEKRAIAARTIPLDAWAGILDREDVNFINLQYGRHEREIERFHARGRGRLETLEDVDPIQELDDFAALIASLDLVITIDNSTAHIAGALETPVWIMLPCSADWRWLQDRGDSIWYLSARLFRQGEPGATGWQAVLESVGEALGDLVADGMPAAGLPNVSDGNPCTVDEAGTLPNHLPAAGTAKALLINDTSNWYHWGCSCTSLAIHEQLGTLGYEVSSLPIYRTHQLQSLPQSIDDFDDDEVFADFCATHGDVIEELKRTDVVYVNGEGTLHGVNTQTLGLLYLAYLSKTRLNKTVRLINHSCYPEGSERLMPGVPASLYAKVYRALDFVAVREQVSARLLSRLGIEATLSFDCLPLFVREHYTQEKRVSEPHVLVAGSVAWGADTLTQVSEFVQRIREAGFAVRVLIGANAYPAADDFRFVEALQRSSGGSFELVNATSEAQWLRAIAEADLLFSGRFHHSIAAAFLATPFIVTESNTPKVSGLLEMLALDCAVSKSDPDLANTLIERAQHYIADPSEALISPETRERLLSLSLKNFNES